MSDDLAVHGALYQALIASTPLAALVDRRIWDEVPEATDDRTPTLPFVVLADSSSRNLTAGGIDCGALTEIDTEILVYSRPSQKGTGQGSDEAKRIVAAIRGAVGDDAALSAPGWAFSLQRWLSTSYRRTEDGRTFVATVTVRTRIQPGD